MPLPRRVVSAIEQLGRDASMVAGKWMGRRSPTFTTRAPGQRARRSGGDAAARTAALLAPRVVRVAEVVRETPDAVTLVLEDPTGAAIHYAPGQFFTLLVPIGDEVLRRAYSASSDARDTSRVAVTVKRVAGGVVSNHLNDRVAAGDVIQVLGPSGSFVAEPSSGAERHLVLVAGGSGITPMMSIVRTVLAVEERTRITLVYGNRALSDVIFHDAIAEVARASAGRLTVRHVLSDPPPGWSDGVGMLEERVVRAELEASGALHGEPTFYVCGPEPMMKATRAALRSLGVADGRILEERFNMPHLRARPTAAAASTQLLTIRTGGGVREVYVAPEQTMLEAGLGAGVRMDYSCAMGGCAACKVRLCDGEVEMEEPNCLSADERAQGYVLACVSRVRTASTIALAGDAAYSAPQAAE